MSVNHTTTTLNCTIITDLFPLAKQPNNISIPLKTHQLALIHKCRELEQSIETGIDDSNYYYKSKIGIIGDKVGSGKTLSVLGIISNKKILQNNELPMTVNKSSLIYYKQNNHNQIENEYFKPYNIIVVPHTILNQWRDTINNCTNLSFFEISNKKTLVQFTDIFNNTKNNDSYKTFTKYDIILISNSKYNEFCMLNLKYWKMNSIFSRVIFDEADTIKIPSCRTIKSSFVWFVSSTYKYLIQPNKVQYLNPNTGEISDTYSYDFNQYIYNGGLRHSGFIKNTVNTLNTLPNTIIKNIVFRNKTSFIKQSFALPEYRMNIIKCKTSYYLNILGNTISSGVLNHINAGDIEGAIEQFNCNKVEESNLICVVTKDLHSKLDNLVIELEMKSKMTYSNKKYKEEILGKIQEKIGECEKKISFIKEKLETSKQCSICYDDIKNTTVAPCCNTKYCFECLSKWHIINKKCPFCRQVINLESLIMISNSTKFIVKNKLLDKLDNLKLIIEKCMTKQPFKMLIFSDYYNSFYKILDILNYYQLKYSKVMGASGCIKNIITNFKDTNTDNERKIDVLLLNANYCASGINLENTTDIVFYHSMNNEKTQQIIGRGQRPGRTTPLNIWKLCYSNEIK